MQRADFIAKNGMGAFLKVGVTMSTAYGRVFTLIREGREVYDAVYQASYRHNSRRISNTTDTTAPMWPSQASAVAALSRVAVNDGCSIMIRDGKGNDLSGLLK